MKNSIVFGMILCLLCGLLGGCGAEAPESTPEPDYSSLIVPPVDVTITNCIREQELSSILGCTVSLLGLGEDGSQAVYQSMDGTCVVSIHLINQTRAGFDAMVANAAVAMELQEGLGEIAYWYEGKAQLMVYSGGYAVDVAVACLDIPEPGTYVMQIAQSILSRLPRG